MNQRTNLLLADILGWILMSLRVFAVIALLLGRIDIPTCVAAQLILFVLGWLTGTYEHALRKALEPDLTERIERAVKGVHDA